MLNFFKLKKWLFLFIISFFILSCSSIPKKEIHNAEIAIKESEKVNANKYAPEELKNAKEYLSNAQKQVVEGNNDKAKNKAIVAEEMAWKSYFKSLDEFTKSKNSSMKKSMDDAVTSHADKLVKEKFQKAQDLFDEVQKELNKLEILSEKLKKVEE